MGAVGAEGGKLEKFKTESLRKKVSFSIKVTAIGGEIKNGGILNFDIKNKLPRLNQSFLWLGGKMRRRQACKNRKEQLEHALCLRKIGTKTRLKSAENA